MGQRGPGGAEHQPDVLLAAVRGKAEQHAVAQPGCAQRLGSAARPAGAAGRGEHVPLAVACPRAVPLPARLRHQLHGERPDPGRDAAGAHGQRPASPGSARLASSSSVCARSASVEVAKPEVTTGAVQAEFGRGLVDRAGRR